MMFHKQFSVKIPFNMDCVESLSAIMGKEFDKKTKSFRFPSIEIFEVADTVDEFFPEVTNRLRHAEEYREDREIAKEAVHMVYLSRAKSVRFKPKHPDNCNPYPFQAASVYYATYQGRDHVLIADEMGLGKEQPLDAKILTPIGWKTMGEAKVGMRIIGANGKPCFIKGVFPQGVKPAYQVEFSDGTSTTCGLDHLWLVMSDNRRVRKQPPVVKTTREIMKGGILNKKGYCKWYVPLVNPVNYVREELPLDPYVLGALIGDGYLCGGSIVISVPDAKLEILDRLENKLPPTVYVSAHKRHGDHCPQYGLITGGNKNSIMIDIIKELKLDIKSPFRFIPEKYLKGSPEDRLELLRGLMDTDGSAKSNRVNFHTTSIKLAEDVRTLVQSLGGLAWVNTYDRSHESKSTEYQVLIRIGVCPFHLKYKAAGWKKPIRSKFKWIEKIEYIGDVEQQCISVSAEDNLYVTDDFIVTHNTCTSIMIANEIGARKGIFICPNSAKINWQREIQKWSTETDNVGYITSQSTEKEIRRYDYISINYDILEKFKDILLDIKWDIAVCDEAHKIKNAKAKRTKVATEICDSAEYRALLSGSPILNRPAELWNLVHTLNPVYWMNWFDFVGRYCDAKRDPYTGQFDYSGSSHSEELQDKLRMTVMIRRLKKDVLKNLPPKTRQIVEIPATKKFTNLLAAQEKYVGKIRKALDIALNTEIKGDPEAQEHKFREAIRRSGLMSPKEFEEIQSLRKATALAKAPEVADFANLLLEAKPKIGIYAHHIDVQQYFIKHFGKRCVYITGGMSTVARQRAVDAFQNNPKITVFVGSIMAAAEAITLTAADTCVMAEMFWTPGINMQVEDRFHRIGTTNNVLIYYAMLQHSIDYYVANMVVSKMEMIEKSLDTKKSLITRKRRFK